VPETKIFPNLDRISILAAAILLAFTLAVFIDIPSQEINLQLPGIYLNFQINVKIIIALLVAGLTATGADWLIRSHPKFEGKNSIQHWFLPALTSWAIGVVLFQQPFGPLWWAVFGIGSATLIFVLIAEYQVVDLEDTQQFPAMIGIIAVSHALFLILAITIRASDTRLFLSIPTITLAFMLTSLRTTYLRIRTWALGPITVVAIVIAQIGAALLYLPIRPVTFGLVLLGPAYALTSFMGGLLEKRRLRQIIIEPAIVLLVVWGIALFVS
jgi:hypothetical protein